MTHKQTAEVWYLLDEREGNQHSYQLLQPTFVTGIEPRNANAIFRRCNILEWRPYRECVAKSLLRKKRSQGRHTHTHTQNNVQHPDHDTLWLSVRASRYIEQMTYFRYKEWIPILLPQWHCSLSAALSANCLRSIICNCKNCQVRCFLWPE